MREIVDLSWNAESFVSNVEKALTVTTELDQKLKDVATDTQKINFSKPISEVSKLKEMLSAGADMKGFEDIFKEFDKNIPKIKAYLQELKKSMANATNPQEIQALNKVIAQTEKAIQEATKETKSFEKSQVSLRTEIRKNTIELQQLEKQGKTNTEQYKKLRSETANLIDSQKDLQGALKGLSSDTYKVDLGVEGIQMGIAGYQTYLGLMALVGGESKELQEVMTKLLAVQQVAQGVQQISTFLTNKEGLALELKSKWTALSALATAEATTAQKAFNLTLAASGIGAIVIGLGLLVANWDKVSQALSGVTKEQEDLNNAMTESQADMQKATETALEMQIVYNQVQKGTITRKEGIEKLAEAYGTTEEQASKMLANEKLFKDTTEAFKTAAFERAVAMNLIKSAAEEYTKALVEDAEGKFIKTADKIKATRVSGFGQFYQSEQDRAKANSKALEEIKKGQDNKLIEAEKRLTIAELNENKFKINQKDGDKKKETKTIENVYKERLAALESQLEKERSTELKGLEKINEEYRIKTKERFDAIQKDLDEKKITKNQATDLRRKANLLSLEEYNKATDDYKKQVIQKQIDLENEIKKTKIEQAIDGQKKSIDLVNYEYDIKKQVILKAIKDTTNDEIEIRKLLNEQLVLLDIDRANSIVEVNKKALQEILNQIKDLGALNQSEIDKNLSAEVLSITESYNKGLINKRQYEEQLAKIEKEYDKKKKNERLAEIKKEQANIEDQLKKDPNNTKLKEEANRLIEEANKIATDALKGDKTNLGDTIFGKIFGIDPTSETFNEDKAKILGGLKSMVQSAVDILKEQTRAEIEAYDTAIRLQQQRVNQAQKIADNGNAEYLQMEEERLKEVEAKREEAARRQLEIDAALQASQMLVAIAGAAAQIAQGGIANVIAGIGTITATVAAGFALLNQLNASRPTFYDGTEALGVTDSAKPTTSTGRDDYYIRAHKNERIVPSYINEKLSGVSNKDLPMLVALGQNRINEVGFNVAKVEASNTLGGLETRLDKQEKIQKQLLKSFDNFKVSMNVDESGVAMIVSKIGRAHV